MEKVAYLTAFARIELHKQLTEHDDGYAAVYCDTDSCFSLTERTRNLTHPVEAKWKR
jgi:hypothetical protein